MFDQFITIGLTEQKLKVDSGEWQGSRSQASNIWDLILALDARPCPQRPLKSSITRNLILLLNVGMHRFLEAMRNDQYLAGVEATDWACSVIVIINYHCLSLIWQERGGWLCLRRRSVPSKRCQPWVGSNSSSLFSLPKSAIKEHSSPGWMLVLNVSNISS